MPPGRKPTPTRLKVLRGVHHSKINHDEPVPPPGPPEPPEWLSDSGRKEWDRLVPLLQRSGLVTQLDTDAVARYCELAAEWVRHMAVCRSGGDILELKDAAGKTRYRQTSPSASLARAYAKELRAIAQEFGMTPSSRSRISSADSAVGDPLGDWLTKWNA